MSITPFGVAEQSFAGRPMQGHEARLAELALSNCQHALIKVDVAALKPDRLGQTHAREFAGNGKPQARSAILFRRRRLGLREFLEQPAELLRRHGPTQASASMTYSERPRSVAAMPQPAFLLLNAGNPSASTLLLLLVG